MEFSLGTHSLSLLRYFIKFLKSVFNFFTFLFSQIYGISPIGILKKWPFMSFLLVSITLSPGSLSGLENKWCHSKTSLLGLRASTLSNQKTVAVAKPNHHFNCFTVKGVSSVKLSSQPSSYCGSYSLQLMSPGICSGHGHSHMLSDL